MGFPGDSDSKQFTCNAEDLGSIPGSGRCPREGKGNPLQSSCLKNPMGRGPWRATFHGVTRSHGSAQPSQPPQPPVTASSWGGRAGARRSARPRPRSSTARAYLAKSRANPEQFGSPQMPRALNVQRDPNQRTRGGRCRGWEEEVAGNLLGNYRAQDLGVFVTSVPQPTGQGWGRSEGRVVRSPGQRLTLERWSLHPGRDVE